MGFGDPYISREELKRRLGIEDTEDDARIDGAIRGAAQLTEDHCHRQFNTADSVTSRRFLVSSRSRVARIDDFHTTTGLVVKVGDVTSGYTDTWTINEDFIVTPVNGTRNERPDGLYWRIETLQNQRFPYPTSDEPNLEVDANWGWSSVPWNVEEANYILSARLFRRRDSPDGVIGGFEGTPMRVGWMMDPDAERLLRHYVKHVDGMF